MTSTRLQTVLAALHWSQRGLAAILGCSDRLVRMWAQGDSPIPLVVADWLERLAEPHEATTPPEGFQRPPGRPRGS